MSFKLLTPLKSIKVAQCHLNKELKIETKYFTSETKSNRPSSRSSSNTIFKTNTISNRNGRRKTRANTIKPMIEALIDYNLLQNQSNLQNKVDFFITPYNTCLDFKKSMQFGDKLTTCRNLDDIAKKDWKIISNFILKSDKKDFRNCLGVANKELYDKVKNYACTIASKNSGNRNLSHQASICRMKTLRRQSTLSKREIFQSQVQESFNNIRKLSSKNLPNLADSFIMKQDSDILSLENLNENSDFVTTKVDLRQLNQQNDEVGSIISPLLGMMRERKGINQQKTQRVENENEFEIDLKEIKRCTKRHSNDFKPLQNEGIKHQYFSLHNRSGRLSRVEERSQSNSSNLDINTADQYGFMNLFSSSSKILDHIQPVLTNHHKNDINLPVISQNKSCNCIKQMKRKTLPQSSKSIVLHQDNEVSKAFSSCLIPRIRDDSNNNDINLSSSMQSSVSTRINSENDEPNTTNRKSKEESLYQKRKCASFLDALDTMRGCQCNCVALPNLNHIPSKYSSNQDKSSDSSVKELFKKPVKGGEKSINKNMIVYLHNSNPVKKINKQMNGRMTERLHESSTASMLRHYV